jgi:hypothetical protein
MAFIMTECNQSSFGFETLGTREIVARFDGGTISSAGGAFLLRQTDRRLNLLPRLADCFLDGRSQHLNLKGTTAAQTQVFATQIVAPKASKTSWCTMSTSRDSLSASPPRMLIRLMPAR